MKAMIRRVMKMMIIIFMIKKKQDNFSLNIQKNEGTKICPLFFVIC